MDLTPLLERARAFERQGKLEDALAAYREAAANDPGAGEPRIRIVGLLLLRGEAAEAEREAREFAARAKSADAYATLGQVLRLASRHHAAILEFRRACLLKPGDASLRRLLNDATRSRYWSVSAEELGELRGRFEAGRATPAEGCRYFHLRFLKLLLPDVQRWLVTLDEEDLPEGALRAIEADLAAVAQAAEALRAHGPYAPARARVSTASETVEGMLADTDATLRGSLEVLDDRGYSIVPFADLRRVDVLGSGAYFTVRLVGRDGGERTAETPALYYFTEWCRVPEVREGRVTVWRTFRDSFRVGLGLRDFELARADGTALVGLDLVRAIEFL